ncbi:ABC transporter substrate-binding protein [Falcatimonas sp. MSJ-15]|uniref:iron-siderophore ABC transporter substrate-binding protein n=1 Tax=Falcatimonas sp. MSJ-15 TaxID=2841515 RepID=UPI001C0FBCDA|nr:iron-siderophore ABC transporter substrate-binding protein [Falcatimonas sp. MSJ-15]MBU5470541.1 ABC transporter substrate-binding protein [Falcatimonas sp. MSJ-15]
MKKKIVSVILGITMIVGVLSGCGSKTGSENNNTTANEEHNDSSDNVTGETQYPVTITHAYGETVIESKPERVVTLGWGNQDTALALGIVPVGVSAANYGYVTEHKLHEWTDEAFLELGESEPNVFDDTDGYDYEAISDAAPDVILAAYSGMTEEEYNTLSEIAPVVPFEETAWKTSWREQTIRNAEGLGMKEAGEELVKQTEDMIAEKVSEHPEFKGVKAGFFWISADDFSTFYAYLPADPRASYLQDLGFELPKSIKNLAGGGSDFSVTLSRESVEALSDIDLMVVYGDEELLKALQADKIMSEIPAIKNGAVVLLDSTSRLAASTTPSILSIPATIDEYLDVLSEACGKING